MKWRNAFKIATAGLVVLVVWALSLAAAAQFGYVTGQMSVVSKIYEGHRWQQNPQN